MKVRISIFKTQVDTFKELAKEDHITWDLQEDGMQYKGTITGVEIRMLSFFYMLAKRYVIIHTFEVF